MEKFFSKVEPGKLLHVINRFSDITERTIIIPEDNFIQCATLKMEKGKTILPHKHLYRDRHYPQQIAQESWIVIKGKVKCKFYDLDDKVIATPILNEGDASFTLHGGHTYEILEEDTIVYEYKTGPYEGVELDKTFINE
jgi:cupin fold WbuC family metalloprotein